MVLGVASKISNWATNAKRIKRPLKNESSPIMIDTCVVQFLIQKSVKIRNIGLLILNTNAHWPAFDPAITTERSQHLERIDWAHVLYSI